MKTKQYIQTEVVPFVWLSYKNYNKDTGKLQLTNGPPFLSKPQAQNDICVALVFDREILEFYFGGRGAVKEHTSA